ncbi:MAG: hypothetical protein WCK35_05350 [Chloroflexota bacterium]
MKGTLRIHLPTPGDQPGKTSLPVGIIEPIQHQATKTIIGLVSILFPESIGGTRLLTKFIQAARRRIKTQVMRKTGIVENKTG